MKTFLKKVLALCITVLFVFGFASCNSENGTSGDLGQEKGLSYEVASVEGAYTFVAIWVYEVDGEYTLLQLMERAKTDNKLDFEESGGMITSLNNKKNVADLSSCWMLYTSDAELSNTQWGTIPWNAWNGQTLGSSIVGADALPIAKGMVYVWVYQSF